MTGSVYGIGWPNINPVQQMPWGPSQFGSPFQSQLHQLLYNVPQQLQNLQQLTYLQQQQLQQIQQLLLLVPQQFQQAIQQIAWAVSHPQQFQQSPTTLQSFGPTQPSAGGPFPTAPFGQQFFPNQPGQVM